MDSPISGNGARELVIQYYNAHITSQVMTNSTTVCVDHFLTWLYAEGYKVVPVDGPRVARRGKADRRLLIGKSHCAKMAGQ